MGLYRRRGTDALGIFHNYSAPGAAALANPTPAPAPAASPVSVNVNPALVQEQASNFFTPDSPKPLAPQPKPAPRLVPPAPPSPNAIPLQADPGGGSVPATLATTSEGEYYPTTPGQVAGSFLQSPAGKLILVGSIVAATVGIIYWVKKRKS